MITGNDIDDRLVRLAALTVGARPVHNQVTAATRYCWACGCTPTPDTQWWRITAHHANAVHGPGQPCTFPCPWMFMAGLCEPHFFRMAQLHKVNPEQQ